MKGIAFLLMLDHHLFAFYNRLLPGFTFAVPQWMNADDLFLKVGGFGKLCVCLFLFIGGYALYLTYQKNGRWDLARTLHSLYLRYWLVFLILVPIGFAFFRGQPDYFEDAGFCHVFDRFRTSTFMLNFLGLQFSYNREWWFLWLFLSCTLFGYGYTLATRKVKDFWLDFFLVAALAVWFQVAVPAMKEAPALGKLTGNVNFHLFFELDSTAPCFLMGIVCCKYDALGTLRGLLKRHRLPARMGLCLAGLISVFFARSYVSWDADFVLVPVFIAFMLELLEPLRPLRKALYVVGCHSNTLWLTHTFFLYYFYPFVRWVYRTPSPFAVYARAFIVSFAASLLLDGLYALIARAGRALSR